MIIFPKPYWSDGLFFDEFLITVLSPPPFFLGFSQLFILKSQYIHRKLQRNVQGSPKPLPSLPLPSLLSYDTESGDWPWYKPQSLFSILVYSWVLYAPICVSVAPCSWIPRVAPWSHPHGLFRTVPSPHDLPPAATHPPPPPHPGNPWFPLLHLPNFAVLRMLCTWNHIAWSFLGSAFFFFLISWRLITLQYCSGFCHTLTWISLGYTCIPHPDPPTHLPLHPGVSFFHWAYFLGDPSKLLDQQFVPFMAAWWTFKQQQ